MQNLISIIEIQDQQIKELTIAGIILLILLAIAMIVIFRLMIINADLRHDMRVQRSKMITPEELEVTVENVRKGIRQYYSDPTDAKAVNKVSRDPATPRIIRNHY